MVPLRVISGSSGTIFKLKAIKWDIIIIGMLKPKVYKTYFFSLYKQDITTEKTSIIIVWYESTEYNNPDCNTNINKIIYLILLIVKIKH